MKVVVVIGRARLHLRVVPPGGCSKSGLSSVWRAHREGRLVSHRQHDGACAGATSESGYRPTIPLDVGHVVLHLCNIVGVMMGGSSAFDISSSLFPYERGVCFMYLSSFTLQ